MRIAIVTEKPHMARTIHNVARELFPADTLDYLIVWPIGLYQPHLPRGLRWHDYPHIAPFQVNDFVRRAGPPGSAMASLMGARGNRKSGDDLLFVPQEDAFRQTLRGADRIICLMDPSEHMYHADVVLQRALGRGIGTNEARRLCALDQKSIERALLGGSLADDAIISRLVSRGRARYYFNYQFALNSLAVLGPATGETGAGRWVSKYQLQLLYAFGKQAPASQGDWIGRMHQWEGTGRYSDREVGCGLGSMISRASIVEQVMAHGWTQTLPVGIGGKSPLVTISPAGEAMIERLHPGCEDADLPFRLDAWAGRGLDATKAEIDRYILTFFGRQKRFRPEATPSPQDASMPA